MSKCEFLVKPLGGLVYFYPRMIPILIWQMSYNFSLTTIFQIKLSLYLRLCKWNSIHGFPFSLHWNICLTYIKTYCSNLQRLLYTQINLCDIQEQQAQVLRNLKVSVKRLMQDNAPYKYKSFNKISFDLSWKHPLIVSKCRTKKIWITILLKVR